MWFARQADAWEAASEATMRAQGIPVERLSVEEGARLFPSFQGDDLEFVLYEPEAGRAARAEGGPDAGRAGRRARREAGAGPGAPGGGAASW